MGGERIVTEIMGSELMTAAAHGVTSKSMSVVGVRRKAVSMATPPMTNVPAATMGSKSMKATAPAVATASAVPTTTSAVPTASTAFCDCRSVRDDAKRANRNARCQNTYCFLFHGGFAQSTSKASGSQRSRTDLPNLTIVDAASFGIGKSKFH